MKDALKLIGAIVLIGLALFLFKRSSDQSKESQDFPDGAHYLCGACKHEFSMSLGDVSEWTRSPDRGKTIPCPKCQAEKSIRADKCPLEDCGRLYVAKPLTINGRVCCPVCKQPMYDI